MDKTDANDRALEALLIRAALIMHAAADRAVRRLPDSPAERAERIQAIARAGLKVAALAEAALVMTLPEER